MNRRQLFCQGIAGLAAASTSGWVLRCDAAPTEATPDVHNYEAFLDSKGVPRVSPAGRWESSYEDILGPFFVQGAPFRGKVTPPLEPGEPLVIQGRIWAHDTKKPIVNAVIDVWQADAKGKYDMDDPKSPPDRSEFRNRIRLVTDETGLYEYETIKPGKYRVGRGFRPAHIHYMIQAPGYQKLVTQLYFKGDPSIAGDRWASRSNLIIAPEKVKVGGATYEMGTFDIVLAK